MSRSPYATDLTDAQWAILQPLLPQPRFRGRPRHHSRREILNAILYQLRSGHAWHLLPHDLPPWRTVYWYFQTWTRDGTWSRMHDALVDLVRQQEQRDPQPTAIIVDTQSVKSTEKGGSVAR
jgi:transposase